jgi:hypothetical protein
MIRRYLFPSVGSSGATSGCLHPTWTLKIRWHNCSDTIHQRCVGSSGAEDPANKSSLLASTRPSDRPTLPLDQGVGASDADDFVLARLCLDSNWASGRPTVSSLRPLDHPVLLSSLLLPCNSSDATKKMDHWFIQRCLGFHPLNQLVRRLHRRLLLSDRRFIRRCLFFSFSCLVLILDFLTLACDILASLGPRSVYKDALNTMVSPIDHVVMNHQNQTRTNDIRGHVRYIYPL